MVEGCSIGVCNRVRLGVKFVCTVYSASGPMVSVVGDDGSGDPLHERCDESDVYEGEVAQVDVVPELVGWFDGVINGLRSLQNILSVIFIKYYLTTRRTNDNTEYKYCTVAKVTIYVYLLGPTSVLYTFVYISYIDTVPIYIYLASYIHTHRVDLIRAEP